MVVTYGVDGNDGANARQSAVWYGKQIDGPFLYENMGPIANFSFETHGLEVTFDGSSSIDLNGNGIAEYQWDFGDGTNGTGEVTDHRYNETGDYNVILRVINEDGLANSTASIVPLSLKKEEFNAFMVLLILLLILTVAAVVYRILRKGGGQKPQPIVVEPEA
jgi:PKD repeat protein